ncbi:hypothetical protein [Parasphingorhabdus sp.]|uniref:hypothetical protein n=1 Tax=Parasphingorhabdus sp. TaxID=2709688 RepID=UPI0032655A15
MIHQSKHNMIGDSFERGKAKALEKIDAEAADTHFLTELRLLQKKEFKNLRTEVERKLAHTNYQTERIDDEQFRIRTDHARGQKSSMRFRLMPAQNHKYRTEVAIEIWTPSTPNGFRSYGNKTIAKSLEMLGEFIVRFPCRTEFEIAQEEAYWFAQNTQQRTRRRNKRLRQLLWFAIIVSVVNFGQWQTL